MELSNKMEGLIFDPTKGREAAVKVDEDLDQEFNDWAQEKREESLRSELETSHRTNAELVKELTNYRAVECEQKKDASDGAVVDKPPLWIQYHEDAIVALGRDVPEMFPHLCETEADVQYFEARVTRDGYSPLTAKIFITKAYRRGDVLKYISVRFPSAGTIKVRKLEFLDLRTSRESDPIDSH